MQRIPPKKATYHSQAAFTRVELMMVVLSGLLVGSIALPSFASHRPRQDKTLCRLNLLKISEAFHAWSADHEDRFPGSVSQSQGGSQGATLAAQFYGALSNHLDSPLSLICPASLKKPGATFDRLQNRNVSYSYGAHATPLKQTEILASDLDISGGSPSVCDRVGNSLVTSFEGSSGVPSSFTARWSTTNHIASGNLLLTDGSVVTGDNVMLRTVFAESIRNGIRPVHLLMPE